MYFQKNSDQEVDQGQVPGHSGTELCLALMLVMQRVTRQQSGRKSAMLPGAEDPNERVSVQTMVRFFFPLHSVFVFYCYTWGCIAKAYLKQS